MILVSFLTVLVGDRSEVLLLVDGHGLGDLAISSEKDPDPELAGLPIGLPISLLWLPFKFPTRPR